MLLTKITAAQNEVALSYHKLRGLYFLAAVFTATFVIKRNLKSGVYDTLLSLTVGV